MTDLLDHLDTALEPARLTEKPSRSWHTARDAAAHDTIASPARALLGTLAAAAGVLLLVAAARTFSDDAARGAAFAIGGWCELLFALAMGVRPSRGSLRAGGALHAVVLLVGMIGFGASGLADGALTRLGAVSVVALAGAMLLVTITLMARPAIGATWTSGTSVILSVVPVAVLVLATAGVVAPSATNGPRTVVRVVSKSGATPSVLPAGVEQLFAAALPNVKGTAASKSKFTSIASGNDTEQSEKEPFVPLDAKTQATLSHQLTLARQAAFRYPTVADARRAGMVPAGGMAPGVGYHMQLIAGNIFKGINPDGSVDPLYPASWIYAGTASSSPVVGVMYESLDLARPTGFAGPNDHWHQHSNVCVKFGGAGIQVPFAADQNVTPQQCADVKGQFMKRTVWMVHAWVVPGWESPTSVFSHDNLHVICPDSTVNVDAIGFCTNQ